MPDRHRQDKATFRPPPEAKKAAQDVLNSRDDWTMNDFLVACLVLLAKNPDAMLTLLAEFKPEPRRGRPKRPDTKTP